MKSKTKFIFLSLLLLPLICSIVACSTHKSRMLEYYSVDDNYVELVGEVAEKKRYRENDDIILYVEIISSNKEFYNPYYGSSPFLLYTNKEILDNISVGDIIEFTSAPRIFYDGQKRPIVALSKEGQELLSFEEGKQGYIKWIQEDF